MSTPVTAHYLEQFRKAKTRLSGQHDSVGNGICVRKLSRHLTLRGFLRPVKRIGNTLIQDRLKKVISHYQKTM